MGDLVVWEGEGGQVYMFQSELPYKYAEYKGVGYHVAANVKEHTVLGGGVYGIGRLYPIPVGIRLPSSARANNLFIWAIGAAPVYLPDHARFGSLLCTTNDGGEEQCYPGACDWVACFQVSLAWPPASSMTTHQVVEDESARVKTKVAAMATPEVPPSPLLPPPPTPPPPTPPPPTPPTPPTPSTPPPPSRVPSARSWRGVSLGGWLVMEINPRFAPAGASADVRPSWMFDQIEADSELDFVIGLRREGGDAHAIATMRNHWQHYLTDEMLDTAVELGINAVRIPVGYWITEPPVGGTSAYEYGFSAEGFVTGGLNHLQAMLPKLRTRGITALLDVHSLPCGQACISNGLSCDAPYAFAASNDSMPGVVVGTIPRCKGEHHEMEHGNYSTSRTPGAVSGIVSWGDVAVESVAALARWIASLPPDLSQVIGALQVTNV
jgi:hypothetical protein